MDDQSHFKGMLYGLLPFVGKAKEPLDDIEAELEERMKNERYHRINKKARDADW